MRQISAIALINPTRSFANTTRSLRRWEPPSLDTLPLQWIINKGEPADREMLVESVKLEIWAERSGGMLNVLVY